LSVRAGYISTTTVEGKEKTKLNDDKLMRLGSVAKTSVSFLMPIFYRYVGRPFGLQLPNYLTTAICLAFISRAKFVVEHLGYVLFPLPKRT
jgi:hypothetical protein